MVGVKSYVAIFLSVGVLYSVKSVLKQAVIFVTATFVINVFTFFFFSMNFLDFRNTNPQIIYYDHDQRHLLQRDSTVIRFVHSTF